MRTLLTRMGILFVTIETCWAADVSIISATTSEIVWTQSFNSAAVTVEQSDNLVSSPYLPLWVDFVSAGTYTSLVLTVTDSFIRVVSADNAATPAGMALIPAGFFQMGENNEAPPNVPGSDEIPVHTVEISTFYIDQFEVTNEKMREAMQWAFDNNLIVATSTTVTNSEGQAQELLDLENTNGMGGHGNGGPPQISFSNGTFSVDSGKENFPCVFVTWYGAMAFCNYRSDMDGLNRAIDFTDWSIDASKNGHRLPTEAEWEKAARGGLTGNHYPWNSNAGIYSDHIDESFANYTDSLDPFDGTWTNAPELSPVGYYDGNQTPAGEDMSNGYGLYDMGGNVWELCWDWYEANWYGNAGATDNDTQGPESGSFGSRVIRGGSWFNVTLGLRCANRSFLSPSNYGSNIGFRCVRMP